MMVKGLAGSLLLANLVASVSGKNTPLYKDATAPVEKRVKDLLGRMTIEDKMAQLLQGIVLEIILRLGSEILTLISYQAMLPTG